MSRWFGPRLNELSRVGSTVTAYVPSTTPISALAASVGTNMEVADLEESCEAGAVLLSAEQALSASAAVSRMKRRACVGAFIGVNLELAIELGSGFGGQERESQELTRHAGASSGRNKGNAGATNRGFEALRHHGRKTDPFRKVRSFWTPAFGRKERRSEGASEANCLENRILLWYARHTL